MPPHFDAAFRERLAELFAWRRDVRRFRSEPVEEAVLAACLSFASLSPSVGNSQPWRFVRVAQPARREAVAESFARCNAQAYETYDGARRDLYSQLKLEGLHQAPVHLAVFCDEATAAGWGLGRATMPEMLHYSAVIAVHAFWLAARAHGLGVGWISILEPKRVTRLLDVPEAWRLIAYLCVGYPVEEHRDPELIRHGWQERVTTAGSLLER